jgi:hypothetical protein
MTLPEHFENKRLYHCFAVIVLVAICSLTVNLVTRYYSPALGTPSQTVKAVRTNTSADASRQRLAKDGAHWLPPTAYIDIRRVPTFYPRVAPAGPLVTSLFSEQNLYNRPPPSVESL